MPKTRNTISTNNAPAAIGPYSQGITFGDLVFTAGQIPVNPASGKIEVDSVAEQTGQALKNLLAVLEAGGSDLNHVLKVTVFMTDLGCFAEMNEVYGRFFTDAPPARSAFQVSALPLGSKVEIEAIAARSNE